MSHEDDWLKALEEPVVHSAEVVEAEEVDFFRDIQSTLYQQASKIVEHALLFNEIDPVDPNPPERWVLKYGEEEARKMHQMARAAWMKGSEAPIGLQMASRQVLGIMKAKATEEAAPRSLSVTLVQAAPVPAFPEKIIDDTKKRY
jgi:hypothetical protein